MSYKGKLDSNSKGLPYRLICASPQSLSAIKIGVNVWPNCDS